MQVIYKEGGLLLPYTSDRYAIHQIVYDLCIGKHNHRERTFLFDVKTVWNNDKAQTFVTVRGVEFTGPIQTFQKTTGFTLGETIRATACIPTVKRTTGAPGEIKMKHNYLFNDSEKVRDFITYRIEQNGFTPKKITITQQQRVNISKDPNKQIIVPTARFIFSAIVNNAEKASAAWLSGIGRCKGMGFGLIEEVSDD